MSRYERERNLKMLKAWRRRTSRNGDKALTDTKAKRAMNQMQHKPYGGLYTCEK